MKKVAAVYTVASVYGYFPDLIRDSLGEVEIVNTFDDFLAIDPGRRGEFTVNNLNRLHAILRCAEMTNPDAIVVTCSTLTPPVETLRPLIATPLVTIDGRLLRLTVTKGPKIAILATAQSAVDAMIIGLRREADLAGAEAAIDTVVCPEAIAALKKNDKATHDRLVLEAAAGIKGVDVVALAQASMAHLEAEVRDATGIETLSSPKLCMAELREVLETTSK